MLRNADGISNRSDKKNSSGKDGESTARVRAIGKLSAGSRNRNNYFGKARSIDRSIVFSSSYCAVRSQSRSVSYRKEHIAILFAREGCIG
jgi:hypothetical protein